MPDGAAPFRFNSARADARINPYVERIREHAPFALTAEEAEALRGRWREEIGVAPGAPLLLEIGPGNGFFFRELCRRFPEAAVVGVEIRFKRVWMTARKARQWGLSRFRVVHHHAAYLSDIFDAGEVDAVFLNHPDPWPRERDHRNRLLAPPMREDLLRVLRPRGEFWLKSDFAEYGPLARSLFAAAPWRDLAFCPDLHGPAGDALRRAAPEGSRFWAADIVTNYERKTREAGGTILVAGYAVDPAGPAPAGPSASQPAAGADADLRGEGALLERAAAIPERHLPEGDGGS